MSADRKIVADPPKGKTLYSEKRFSLRRCEILLSDGSVESRGLMIHSGAVVIVPTLEDGRIILIRNTRWQVGQTLLELPAGTMEPNELPITCAKRELLEETGYTADKFSPIQSFFAAPGVSTEIMHPYRATQLRFVGQNLALDEQIEVIPMHRTSIVSALHNGDIIDGKTIAVLALAGLI